MNSYDLQVVLDKLACLEGILGICLIGFGLTFMLVGFRIFKFVVTLSIGVVGFVIGLNLPGSLMQQAICSLVLAFGLAVLSIFMYKAAVGILASGWSGLAIMILADNFGIDENMTMLLGGIVFVAVLSLSIVMYEEIVVYVTSLEGTLLFLSGFVVFVSQNESVWRHARQIMLDTPSFVVFAIVCGTVTAFYLQIAELAKKRSGTSG